MAFTQPPDFTFKHVDQADKPGYAAEELKVKFDSQAKELRDYLINTLLPQLASTTDGSSGADNIGMTPIAETGAASTIQAVVEALITRLKATTDSASGADLVGATAIPGLTGATVQALLEALKTLVDTKAASTDVSNLAGVGRTTETVKGNADNLTAHLADKVQHIPYAVASGSANAYLVTVNGVTSYQDGFAVAVKINVDNTGASTLNVNGFGTKAIKKPNGLDVSAGNLKAGSIYTLRYNGTNFILQGEGGSGTAQPADVLSGKTFTNDQGERTGTMPNRGAVVITPSTTNQVIAAGYHNGSGYVEGDANLVARNVKKGVSIFGVSGSVKPGWVLFAANGLYNNYNWGSFVAGYTNGTPSRQEISSNKISLDTGSSCSDVAMVTNDPIDLTGIDYVCAVIDPSSYGAVSTYLIVDTNKVAPYSTYVARVSGASDAGDSIQGLVLNVSSLSGLYYIRLHLAATSRYIYCYLVSLG